MAGNPSTADRFPRSGCVSVAALAAVLRTTGAGRVSDTFILPLAEGRYGLVHSAVTVLVTYRGHRQQCYLRSAQVPFDLLPFRPAADARRGAWFSIGPGLGPEPADPRVHPAVIQVQIEGSRDEIAYLASRITDRLMAAGVRMARAVVADATGWHRMCLGGLLEGADHGEFVWEGFL